MSKLYQQVCEPCHQNTGIMSEEKQQDLLGMLDGWEITDEEDVPQLLKIIKCHDFLSALDVANKVGELAEVSNHHPALLVEWGKVTVRWWTHSIGGLHKNDFIMAAKTDQIEVK